MIYLLQNDSCPRGVPFTPCAFRPHITTISQTTINKRWARGYMKLLKSFIVALTLGTALGLALTLTGSNSQPVSAHEDNKPAAQQTGSTQSGPSYNYVAQSGDSYSGLARKAIQTYGLKNKVKLSGAQIVFAETNLAQAADSPLLLAGQKVSISESTVKDWVQKAQKLTDAQEQAWDYYVQSVDFNTNAAGQSR